MSLFEYIMVLTSILIALGLAELLNGIVRSLRSEFEEKIYIPQILWTVLAFVFLLLIWWSRWDLRDNIEWNFLQLLMSLAGPVLIFIVSGLIYPHNKDSREYYYRQKNKILILFIMVFLVSILHEILIEGSPALSLATGLLSLHILACIYAVFSNKEFPQFLAPIVALSGITYYLYTTISTLME